MAEEEENKINLDLSLGFDQLPLKRKAIDALRSSSEGYNGNFGVGNQPLNTSSDISHTYRCNSCSGGNSSDTSSNSSCHRISSHAANQPTVNPSVNEPVSSPKETHLNHNPCSKKITSTNIIPQPSQTQCEKKCALDKQSSPMPRSPSPKEAKVAIGKPPKPNRQMSQQSVLLPQMPCVSATGNGPNGKTISGFLYKYSSKTEVSIVCVCHGTSFSPASFVEHAGGVDIEHPLKHIRVVPFALG